MRDYRRRRDVDNCDPFRMTRARVKYEPDELEQSLSEKCQRLQRPMRYLNKETKAWLGLYNSCGDGKPRKGFQKRILYRLRKIRSRVYFRVGCENEPIKGKKHKKDKS